MLTGSAREVTAGRSARQPFHTAPQRVRRRVDACTRVDAKSSRRRRHWPFNQWRNRGHRRRGSGHER
jgi:hypothetical protein